jgi:Tol biopolymer transport system component
VITPDGRDAKMLTRDRGLTYPGSWAPDETRLAVAVRRNGVWNIAWVSRLDGRVHPLTNFTEPAAFVRYPAWSPTGDRIVYERAAIAGNAWLAAPTRSAAADNVEMTLKEPSHNPSRAPADAMP